MSNSYQFPIRPQVFPGESLRGYMKRLAHLLHANSVAALLIASGVKSDATGLGSLGDVNRLSDALGMSPNDIGRMRFQHTETKVGLFLGTEIDRIYVDHQRVRVCPGCLRDAPYHRQIWDLAFVGACPSHRESLIVNCQACGCSLKWNSTSMLNCTSCGSDLRTQKGLPIGENAAVAIARLLRPLHDQAVLPGAELPGLISSLSYNASLSLMLFLGRLKKEAEGAVRLGGKAARGQQLMEYLSEGLSVLDDWPRAFDDLMLDRWSKRQSDTGLQVAFGYVYRRMMRPSRSGWEGLVKTAFSDFLVNHEEIACPPSSAFAERVLARRGHKFVPMEALRSSLALGKGEFRALRRSKLWKDVNQIDVCKRGFVRSSDVRTLKKKLQTVMSTGELGRTLGIKNVSTIAKIGKSGVFKKAPQEYVLNRSSILFLKADVLRFIEPLSSLPIIAPGGGLIDYYRVVAKATVRGLEHADILKLIRSGELAPIGRLEGEGLPKILFDEESAGLVLDKLADRKIDAVSVRAAAKRLGRATNSLYKVLKREGISLHQPAGMRIGHIDRNDFQRLTRRYKKVPPRRRGDGRPNLTA